MEIYLASNNAHKQNEFAALFRGYDIIIPRERGIAFDHEETGNSFAENCLIKARYLFELARENPAPLILADDSGLCVDILGGRPGIHTARYAGAFPLPRGIAPPPQDEQNRLLVEEVNAAVDSLGASVVKSCAAAGEQRIAHNGGGEPRSCRYVCALALYVSRERFFLVQETMEGAIIPSIDQARGSEGFGYDPVVFIKEFGRTVAELSAREKNDVSHRGKAARALQTFCTETLRLP
jgi:XTP/dITP diphosphohydrolase